MTPPSSTPQPAGWTSARHRVHQILTRARTLWRDMTGESAYNHYLERYAREHAQCSYGHRGAHGSEHSSEHSPISKCELWRAWARQAGTEANASCC